VSPSLHFSELTNGYLVLFLSLSAPELTPNLVQISTMASAIFILLNTLLVVSTYAASIYPTTQWAFTEGTANKPLSHPHQLAAESPGRGKVRFHQRDQLPMVVFRRGELRSAVFDHLYILHRLVPGTE
jgi:hypothetical protein